MIKNYAKQYITLWIANYITQLYNQKPPIFELSNTFLNPYLNKDSAQKAKENFTNIPPFFMPAIMIQDMALTAWSLVKNHLFEWHPSIAPHIHPILNELRQNSVQETQNAIIHALSERLNIMQTFFEPIKEQNTLPQFSFNNIRDDKFTMIFVPPKGADTNIFSLDSLKNFTKSLQKKGIDCFFWQDKDADIFDITKDSIHQFGEMLQILSQLSKKKKAKIGFFLLADNGHYLEQLSAWGEEFSLAVRIGKFHYNTMRLQMQLSNFIERLAKNPFMSMWCTQVPFMLPNLLRGFDPLYISYHLLNDNQFEQKQLFSNWLSDYMKKPSFFLPKPILSHTNKLNAPLLQLDFPTLSHMQEDDIQAPFTKTIHSSLDFMSLMIDKSSETIWNNITHNIHKILTK